MGRPRATRANTKDDGKTASKNSRDMGSKRARRAVEGLRNGFDVLPTEVLSCVLHMVGRPARLVCRRWHSAFGPPAGIYLSHVSTRRDLVHLVHPSSDLARVRALFLAPPRGTYAFNGAILAALPATFPALRALHLHPRIDVAAPQVPLLAALAPNLTSLNLALPTPKSAAHLPTTLRSLTLHTEPWHFRRAIGHEGYVVRLLTSLTHLLPTLHHFEYHGPQAFWSHFTAPAPAVLPHLSTMSQLTHLCISTMLTNWNRASLALLATAWPRLVALQLALPTPDMANHTPPTPDDVPDVMATLAHRTCLTSLTLNVIPSEHQPLAALPHLSCFELSPNRHLYNSYQVTSLIDAHHPPTALTRLSLADRNLLLTQPLLATLSTIAPTLVQLTLTGRVASLSSLQPLGCLTALHTLDLTTDYVPLHGMPPVAAADRPPAEVARSIGAALTRLTSLTVHEDLRWPLDHLVAAVAAHGRLRFLDVTCALPHPAVCLAPTRATLTRLGIRCHRLDVTATFKSLAAMEALRGLVVYITDSGHYRAQPLDPLPAVGAPQQPAPSMAQAAAAAAGTSGATGPGNSTSGPAAVNGPSGAAVAAAATAAASIVTAATTGVTTRARSAKPGHARAGGRAAAGEAERLLPPGLQLLCVDLADVEPGPRRQLLAVAARQGCAVQSRQRLALYDDCNGHLDGAAPDCVRHG